MKCCARCLSVPSFLFGSGRSGSTPRGLMLDQHPSLSFEFDYVVRTVGDDGAWSNMAYFRRGLSTSRTVFLRGHRIGGRLSDAGFVNDSDRPPAIWPDVRFIPAVRDGREVARLIVGPGGPDVDGYRTVGRVGGCPGMAPSANGFSDLSGSTTRSSAQQRGKP
jgi:hypothetical protein